MGAGKGPASPLPDEKQEVLERIQEWLLTEVSDALSKADTLQIEVHVKGRSIRPKLTILYDL